MEIVEKSKTETVVSYESTKQGKVYRRTETGQYYLAVPKGMINLTTGTYLVAGIDINPKDKQFVPVKATLFIE